MGLETFLKPASESSALDPFLHVRICSLSQRNYVNTLVLARINSVTITLPLHFLILLSDAHLILLLSDAHLLLPLSEALLHLSKALHLLSVAPLTITLRKVLFPCSRTNSLVDLYHKARLERRPSTTGAVTDLTYSFFLITNALNGEKTSFK